MSPAILRFLGVLWFAIFAAAPATGWTAGPPAPPGEPRFGINRVNLAWISRSARRQVLADMAANDVRLVRLSLSEPFEGSIDAVRVAHGHGMNILLEIPLGAKAYYGRETAKRPGFGRVWDMYRLSDIDLDAFRTALAAVLHSLDGLGVALAAIEPGNELNWGAYNGDLHVRPRAGSPSGGAPSALADRPAFEAGLDKYVKILQIVSEELAATRANKWAQIISAGASDVPSELADVRGIERVEASEFIAMLRARGADRHVDAYGLHLYPSRNGTAGERRRRVEGLLSVCAEARHGRPCWITEWGVANPSDRCPLNDDERQRLVREVRGVFEAWMSMDRLAAALYFDWDSDTPYSVWRCGALTPAGRMAVAPYRWAH